MQTKARIFQDIAKTAESVAHVALGAGSELRHAAQDHMHNILNAMDLVTREEFNVIAEVAATARQEQESLSKRVKELEDQISQLIKK